MLFERGEEMNLQLLNNNIKKKCKEKGININQLEKELRFGTGSISRWGQSSPSIEKVVAVADFFGMTLDEICGLSQGKEEVAFMECLISKTHTGDIFWVPCSDGDLLNLSFCPMQLRCNFLELYCANYNVGTFFVGYKEEELELYISLEDNICVKQNEDLEQLQNLWKEIKENELGLKERIDKYKADFVNS